MDSMLAARTCVAVLQVLLTAETSFKVFDHLVGGICSFVVGRVGCAIFFLLLLDGFQKLFVLR